MQKLEQVDQYIAGVTDWRGEVLAELRKLIQEADPEIEETWKWNCPVYMHNGMVCAINAFKGHVKINFFKGAQLPDPHNLINNGLDSKEHRSIDFGKEDKIDRVALRDLIRAAIKLNG